MDGTLDALGTKLGIWVGASTTVRFFQIDSILSAISVVSQKHFWIWIMAFVRWLYGPKMLRHGCVGGFETYRTRSWNNICDIICPNFSIAVVNLIP